MCVLFSSRFMRVFVSLYACISLYVSLGVISENDFNGILGDLDYYISYTFSMSIAGFWHVDSWGMLGTFGMSIAGSRHVDSWGMLGMVVTACAHLSQIIVVHYSRTIVPHCLVFATESPEHRNSRGTIVKVNCEATIFGTDVGWITREAFVFIFNFKNPWIQYVKQSGNNAAICLARFIVYQPDCIVSWGFVPARLVLI